MGARWEGVCSGEPIGRLGRPGWVDDSKLSFTQLHRQGTGDGQGEVRDVA